uniref:Erythromycin biosynthesis protein CIII-like C-terminal domain-containing protein n=1 Tax=Oryza meridionalis TaxID=40149 RepID=A0A0E0CHJ1_9ORYZ
MDGGGGGRRPRAVFMAFGTRGDVFPIAALAAAFAQDQRQYSVVFITHSAHQSLSTHLADCNVRYMPVSSPPVLAAEQLKSISCKCREEGWHLAELFQVKCIIAAPYFVPYSAPASFERQFKQSLPLLYKYFQEAPLNMDPVTNLPLWYMREESPLLLYGFSKEIVECPGLSSIGSMGFLRNPKAFLMVLKAVIEKTDYRFILFSSGYQPLDSAIQSFAPSVAESSEYQASALHCDSNILFNGRLFCFSGWLFPKCAIAIHHAGSGSTAAALFAGIPQISCPFLLDQFYWAERLHWLGVAPEPLRRQHLILDTDNASSINNAADMLIGAIKSALSPEIKAQATRIANKLSSEDGIGEALRILKERVLPQSES